VVLIDEIDQMLANNSFMIVPDEEEKQNLAPFYVPSFF
jgi:hypothetical protein